MRRIIPKQNKPPSAEAQAVHDFKQASIDAAVSLVRDRMSMTELSEVLGVSDDLIRDRLAKTQAKRDKLFWTGRAYQIPYAVGVEFVRSFLNTKRVIRRKVGVLIGDTRKDSLDALVTADSMSVGVSADRYKFYRFTLPEMVARNAELRQAVGKQIQDAYLKGYKNGRSVPLKLARCSS